ncbi:hypothetical protein CRENBAI_022866 [Crenichthys baileyi]|uniref:Uncharacterized protein n=1 Tax=Crenichthys baileyi TaxID=28760 RepID=A0AAV9RI73_9TELE
MAVGPNTVVVSLAKARDPTCLLVVVRRLSGGDCVAALLLSAVATLRLTTTVMLVFQQSLSTVNATTPAEWKRAFWIPWGWGSPGDKSGRIVPLHPPPSVFLLMPRRNCQPSPPSSPSRAIHVRSTQPQPSLREPQRGPFPVRSSFFELST